MLAGVKLKRFKESLHIVAGVYPGSGSTSGVFPQLTVDTVIQALKDVGVTVYSSVFEADGVLAWLGHRFDCPVVSDDSDFFVFGVKCVPLRSLAAAVTSEGRGRTFKK
jgi:hypothetical protein